MYDADKPILVGLLLLVSALLGLIAAGVLGGSSVPFTPGQLGLTKIEVDGTPLYVEIADTPEKRMIGLSEKEILQTNQGMLFVFDESGKYQIWMRNMSFPIDVYWLDGRGVIVDMWENASPDSYPQVFTPRSEAYYILEVIAGFSEVYNITIGDQVTGLSGI
tara:strand:+ start:8281 stop:8766 length:486 start_codon:yes stop_codon:yes gene_type:complete